MHQFGGSYSITTQREWTKLKRGEAAQMSEEYNVINIRL